MSRSIWMKDGFLILVVKSLPGAGEGDQDCGKGIRDQKAKSEVLDIKSPSGIGL